MNADLYPSLPLTRRHHRLTPMVTIALMGVLCGVGIFRAAPVLAQDEQEQPEQEPQEEPEAQDEPYQPANQDQVDPIEQQQRQRETSCIMTGACTCSLGMCTMNSTGERFADPSVSGGSHGLNILPCQYAQNALRPCTNQAVPVGVDGRLVGTWEIVTPTPLGVARWVWEINENGTYRFHAEGPGAVKPHSGTFAASGGQYVLNSTTIAWNDSGTYEVRDSETLVARGKLGPGTWHRVGGKAAGHSERHRITVRK